MISQTDFHPPITRYPHGSQNTGLTLPGPLLSGKISSYSRYQFPIYCSVAPQPTNCLALGQDLPAMGHFAIALQFDADQHAGRVRMRHFQ
jgi:hypothetical protein